jgi:hypothetical protein
MDVKISVKERRLMPDGPADVLTDGVFDLFPVFSEDDPNLITGVEILDGVREELIDRAMFAVVKQRGLDPVEPSDGNQWEEYFIGEIPAPVLIQQITTSAARVGGGVRVVPETVQSGGKYYAVFTVKLTGVSYD